MADNKKQNAKAAKVVAKRYKDTEFVNGNGEVVNTGEDLANTSRKVGSSILVKVGELQKVEGQYTFMGWPRYNEAGEPLKRSDGSQSYIGLSGILRGQEVTPDDDFKELALNLDLTQDLAVLAEQIEGDGKDGSLVELKIIGKDKGGYNNAYRYRYGR